MNHLFPIQPKNKLPFATFMLSFTIKGILDVHFDTKDSEMLTIGEALEFH